MERYLSLFIDINGKQNSSQQSILLGIFHDDFAQPYLRENERICWEKEFLQRRKFNPTCGTQILELSAAQWQISRTNTARCAKEPGRVVETIETVVIANNSKASAIST